MMRKPRDWSAHTDGTLGYCMDADQIYWVEDLLWYVQMHGIVSRRMLLTRFRCLLDLESWSVWDGEDERSVTPNEVLRMMVDGNYPEGCAQNHPCRILFADLRYPIIVQRIDDMWYLLDGYHRLMKAVLQRKTRIRAYLIVGELPPPKKFLAGLKCGRVS